MTSPPSRGPASEPRPPERSTVARWIPHLDVHAERYARLGRGAMSSGWVTNGPEVASFETEFAAAVGARWAVAVSTGAAAIELALHALELPWGSRVLVSDLGSVALPQAIAQAGLCPVLMDVSPVTGMPTAETVGEAARRTAMGDQPARAILIVHPAGDPGEVRSLAEAAGLPRRRVVQDASEALGTSLGDAPMGGDGTACFSFYASSNLPVGQGGMVTTEYADVADNVRRHRVRGSSSLLWRVQRNGNPQSHGLREGGLDASLTDLSAAIGRAQLHHLNAWQHRRSRLAARYDDRLVEISDVALPHRPVPGTGEHAWHHYPVRIDHPAVPGATADRALGEAGIGTARRALPLHRLAHVRDLCEGPIGELPGADRYAQQLVSLPVYPRLPDDTADRVGEVLATLLHSPPGRDHRSN